MQTFYLCKGYWKAPWAGGQAKTHKRKCQCGRLSLMRHIRKDGKVGYWGERRRIWRLPSLKGMLYEERVKKQSKESRHKDTKMKKKKKRKEKKDLLQCWCQPGPLPGPVTQGFHFPVQSHVAQVQKTKISEQELCMTSRSTFQKLQLQNGASSICWAS